MTSTITPRLYGCHNRPRPTPQTTYRVQDGWHAHSFPGTSAPSRLPKIKQIPVVTSLDCRYDKPHTDPGCTDCCHAPVDADFFEPTT